MTKMMHALSFMLLLMSNVAPAKPDFYAILGIDFHESQHGIKQAFRKLSLLWHPDKHHTEEEKEKAQAMFIDISAAYATLGNEETRMVYDEMRGDSSSMERKMWSGSADKANSFYPRTFDSQTSWNSMRAYTMPSQSYYARQVPRAKQAYVNPSQRHYAHKAPYAEQASKSASKRGSGDSGTDSRRNGPYFQAVQPGAFHVGGQDGMAYTNGVDADPHRFDTCIAAKSGHNRCSHPQPTNVYRSQQASRFSKFESQRFGRGDSYAQTFPKEKVIFPKS